MEEHVEQKIAALSERNLIVDHSEELLSLCKLDTTFLDALRGHREGHCVCQHGLVGDQGLLSEQTLG